MGSVYNTVKYCCVCNGSKILYAYNNGGDQDQETAKLAALCLQKAPLHHRWYFETMCDKTFGFLMEDGYVYFSIIDENLGCKKLEFLERVRDAFKKVAKKGSKRMLSPNSAVLQEQLLPVVRRLIDSLEHVSDSVIPNVIPNNDPRIDDNGRVDLGASTKAPLLGKLGKHEKRKMRDHVIAVREGGVVEEHRKADSSGMDLDNHGGSLAGVSLTKEVSSMSRSRSQTLRNKWYRQVRIVLAVDVAVCLVLFVVWMVVCRGTECIR